MNDTAKKPLKKVFRKFSGFKAIATIAIVLLFIAVVALCFGVNRLYQYNRLLLIGNQQIAEQNNKIQSQIDKLSELQASQQKVVEYIQQKNSFSYYVSTLNIVEQLVNGANIAIKVQKNSQLAINLLNLSLDRLNKTHEFNNIADKIRQDISQLEQAQNQAIDKKKILLQLNQVMQLTGGLEQNFVLEKNIEVTKSFAENTTETASNFTIRDKNGDLSWVLLWGVIKEKVSQIFGNMVTITHKENLPTVLTDTQLKSLKLNINTLFLETLFAVNNNDDLAYHNNLNMIAKFLQLYFVNNKEVNDVAIPSIQELQKANIEVVANVDLDKTLELIVLALEQRNVADLISSQ